MGRAKLKGLKEKAYNFHRRKDKVATPMVPNDIWRGEGAILCPIFLREVNHREFVDFAEPFFPETACAS